MFNPGRPYRNHPSPPDFDPGMVDPYAPPEEAPARRPERPLPPVEPYTATTSGQVYRQTYDEPPAHEAYRDRDRPWRRGDSHAPRTEPARPGLFWMVAAFGVGLLCLARLMLFFAV